MARHCENCGAVIPLNATRCENCGSVPQAATYTSANQNQEPTANTAQLVVSFLIPIVGFIYFLYEANNNHHQAANSYALTAFIGFLLEVIILALFLGDTIWWLL